MTIFKPKIESSTTAKVKPFQADLKVEPANSADDDDSPTFKQASLFPTSKENSVPKLSYAKFALLHLVSLILIVLIF